MIGRPHARVSGTAKPITSTQNPPTPFGGTLDEGNVGVRKRERDSWLCPCHARPQENTPNGKQRRKPQKHKIQKHMRKRPSRPFHIRHRNGRRVPTNGPNPGRKAHTLARTAEARLSAAVSPPGSAFVVSGWLPCSAHVRDVATHTMRVWFGWCTPLTTSAVVMKVLVS